MKDVFARLASDFLSTILFLALYLTTDNVVLATSVAIAGAVAQVIYSRVKAKPLGFMTYASVGLVIVLGSATLLTQDPRFVLAKPSIAHFAIGAIMLKRGWMLRYMPPIVTETVPEYVTIAGARRRRHRGRLDRRSQAVGVLCVGGRDRGEDRSFRRAICRVPHSRYRPASRSRPRLKSVFERSGYRFA